MQQKIDYRDYLRGRFSDFDIITSDIAGRCAPADCVNVRGHAASGTTAHFFQGKNNYPYHIESDSSNCAFSNHDGAFSSGAGQLWKNFRCIMADDSTTQWWFGVYMAD